MDSAPRFPDDRIVPAEALRPEIRTDVLIYWIVIGIFAGFLLGVALSAAGLSALQWFR